MCLGIPGKIVEIDGGSAVIEVMGATREISIELVEGLQLGDYVLVHAGCAIQKIDSDEALKTIELFNELREIANE